MIDEMKLIEEIHGYFLDKINDDESETIDHGILKLNKEICEIIKNQPKVNEWIPVEERFPEKAGKYLVTMIEGGAVHTSVRRFNPSPKHPEQNEPIFTKHVPYYSGWERATRGVIAWQPLPAPYDMRKEK